MLFSTTTVSALLASVGEVSGDTFSAVLPYLYVAIGIPLAFYIIKKIISLIPKR